MLPWRRKCPTQRRGVELLVLYKLSLFYCFCVYILNYRSSQFPSSLINPFYYNIWTPIVRLNITLFVCVVVCYTPTFNLPIWYNSKRVIRFSLMWCNWTMKIFKYLLVYALFLCDFSINRLKNIGSPADTKWVGPGGIDPTNRFCLLVKCFKIAYFLKHESINEFVQVFFSNKVTLFVFFV